MTRPPTVAVVHFPSPGHIRPMLTLAAALERHGLGVVQWAPAEWEQACLAAGGEFRALPDLGDLVWPDPTPLRLAEFLGRLTERLAPWMSEQVAACDSDVVLRDSFAQYGRYAALANGLDEVAVPAMMAFHRGARPAMRDLPSFVADLVAGAPSALRLRRVSRQLGRRQGAGLGGPLSVLAGRHGAPTLVMTIPALQLRPEGLRGEDVRFVGPLRALGPAEGAPEPALDGVEDADRLIYVSLGTVFEQQPEFFRAAAVALSAPGRHVIMSIGRLAPETVGPLPAGVSVHAHVDQLAVLGRADAFLTHGGFNSVQEGLAAGVPLLLCPQMFEQAMNAEVVVARGAGVRIGRAPTVRAIRSAAAKLLDERDYGEAARRLAAEMRAGERTGEAVGLVAGLARAGRRRS